ncbi:hypothetical protein [Kitasatospora sp. NPDC088346]|uniref:hypothetical protein n=1 Tax=Kitasatospora sp. NPDC088346 TaxID=3364073 RepID=UPI00381737BC
MDHFAATDVPEPDGWDAWLAHADALTAADDPRGEVIRLEHACDTAGGDRALLAAAYTDLERRLGLDGLRQDGSWTFTWSRGHLDGARFDLAEHTRPDRRELSTGSWPTTRTPRPPTPPTPNSGKAY